MKDGNGEYYYQDFTIEKMGSVNSVVVTPGKSLKLELGFPIDENTLFYATPYYGANWLLIAQGTELYIVDRNNIGANTSTYVRHYMSFDANITDMDSECYNSTRLGVGLENGRFFVLNLGTTLPADESGRVLYESPSDFGKIVDIRFKVRTGNNWPR